MTIAIRKLDASDADFKQTLSAVLAFEAGRMPRRLYASASSPVTGVVGH